MERQFCIDVLRMYDLYMCIGFASLDVVYDGLHECAWYHGM